MEGGEGTHAFDKIRQKFNIPAKPVLPKAADSKPVSAHRSIDWITKDGGLSSHSALERGSSFRRDDWLSREKLQRDGQGPSQELAAQTDAEEGSGTSESAYVDEASGADLKKKLSVFEKASHGGVTFKPIPGLNKVIPPGVHSSPDRTNSLTAASPAHSGTPSNSRSPGLGARAFSLSSHTSPPVFRIQDTAELNNSPQPVNLEADKRQDATAGAANTSASGYIDDAAAADLKQKLSRFEKEIEDSKAKAERAKPLPGPGIRTFTHTAGSQIPRPPEAQPRASMQRSATTTAGSIPSTCAQSSSEAKSLPALSQQVPKGDHGFSSASLAAIHKFQDPVLLQKMLVQKEIELHAERVRAKQAEEWARTSRPSRDPKPVSKSLPQSIAITVQRWDEKNVNRVKSALSATALEHQTLLENIRQLQTRLEDQEAAREVAEAMSRKPPLVPHLV